MITHQPYPSDVSDAEWEFVRPYLCLLPEDAGQREHGLRDVFDALRWMVRSGSPWRYLPKDFPPWEAVYQQTRRWLAAGCFEAIVHDLRAVLRVRRGPRSRATAVIFDSRTIQSTPESGPRAGYDGYKRRKGSKVHMAVDTLGHLLALHVTPADEQDRAQVGILAEAVQEVTGESVELAYVDQGYTGEDAEAPRPSYGIRLEVVKLPEAKTRLRAAAASLGGGAIVRLGGAIPATGAGLRAAGRRRWRVCITSRSASSCSARPPRTSVGVHNTL